jgi:adrenodoxin-NADP+ reductase
MNKNHDAVVDMYEQLPVPYGLVRYGVAPDHPEVKNCQDTFEEVALSPRFSYIGNVKVGYDIELAQMKPHYDAILFAYGASEDRQLGIPGEDLPGIYSARSFVGWYNGLPQFQGLKPNLRAGEQAVVIGQGNVALDVARILLSPVDALRSTDIADQAIQALSESKIRSVRVVGRRGPVQVSCTLDSGDTALTDLGCLYSQGSS